MSKHMSKHTMEVHSGDVEGPRKGQRAEWLERSKMEGKGKEKGVDLQPGQQTAVGAGPA